MPIRHELWTVPHDSLESPMALQSASLSSERLLEDMIVAQPRILSSEWMLIGRQVETGLGGILDLLAVAPDGSLVLIELKRSRTPREVVAQALDYASWLQTIDAERIADIYSRFSSGRSLGADFRARFGVELDEAALNESHQIVVAAAQLDPSTECIVSYLSDRGIAINVMLFQVFELGDRQILSRAWLIDPNEVQVHASLSTRGGEQEPWNGEFYVNFGADRNRSWEEAQKYGFISADNGTWYTNTLNLLQPGDRIWVQIPKKGFVGVGKVLGTRTALNDFKIEGRPAIDVLNANYLRDRAQDPDRCEYFVPVEWLSVVDESEAVQEVGLFGNQNTVCRPKTQKWRTTVEFLKERFRIV